MASFAKKTIANNDHHQSTNLGVRSSNLFGRATLPPTQSAQMATPRLARQVEIAVHLTSTRQREHKGSSQIQAVHDCVGNVGHDLFFIEVVSRKVLAEFIEGTVGAESWVGEELPHL